MRVRKKKHGSERILACSRFLIEDPRTLFENLGSAFTQDRPIHLEIGCGKGSFAVRLASVRQDINLIAMEKVSDVAVTALERAALTENERDDNLKFIIGDAKFLPEYFPAHSIDTIYINFCDPWPKKGHAKRRLTHHSFLEIYRKILKKDGMLIFKTDNENLFDFSMEEFLSSGLQILYHTKDLHNENTKISKENIMTEYEYNFSSKGYKICSAHVKFTEEAEEKDA